MTPDQILRCLDELASFTGISAGTLGRKASGSGDFSPRLRRGHDITSRRAARVAQWLSDHWPPETELQWPADIPRPDPQPDREAA